MTRDTIRSQEELYLSTDCIQIQLSNSQDCISECLAKIRFEEFFGAAQEEVGVFPVGRFR